MILIPQEKTQYRYHMNKDHKPTKANEAAARMPALTHWRDRTKPWAPEQSDVIAWLVTQPDIAIALLQKFEQSGAIVFDPATKTWSGRDHQATST